MLSVSWNEINCLSITVVPQGHYTWQCCFCKVLQLVLLGRNLHLCISAIAFAYVAVDELDFLPHRVHCWHSESVATVTLFGAFCGSFLSEELEEEILSKESFLLCAAFQVYSLYIEIKTVYYSRFSTFNGNFWFHYYTYRGSASSMLLLKENDNHWKQILNGWVLPIALLFS